MVSVRQLVYSSLIGVGVSVIVGPEIGFIASIGALVYYIYQNNEVEQEEEVVEEV